MRAHGGKRAASVLAASLALSLLAVAGVASCKQGEGERCQVAEDCEEGLVCSVSEGLCRSSDTAGPIDAVPPDGLPDAPPDAMPDGPMPDGP